MLTRRELMIHAAADLAAYMALGRPDDSLIAHRIKSTAAGVIWRIGPPGERLRKFTEALAGIVYNAAELAEPFWRDPEVAAVSGGWGDAVNRSHREWLVFDDTPLRGREWVSAEEKMIQAARIAGISIRFEG